MSPEIFPGRGTDMRKGGRQLIRFNLVDEPCIQVLSAEGHVDEVGLQDLLLNAQSYVDIGGEMATQDVAVLRVLLAIVHTIITRMDQDGNESAIEDEDEALERWEAIWERGCFPEKSIRAYFEKWHERFWLFHPERPFYQVPEIFGMTVENALEKTGLADPMASKKNVKAVFNGAKLNGEVGESGNKIRLFAPRSGLAKRKMSYAEAARWLITLQAFDDASGKESKENKSAKKQETSESIGVGWLGKLSLVHAVGKNLFETLMLNCVLLRNGRNELFGEDLPTWEKDSLEIRERHFIPVPDDFAGLLTLQSRRILLIPDTDGVLGFAAYGGDYFSREGAVNEQFTLWTIPKVPKGKVALPVPRYQDMPAQMWREVSSLLIQNESNTDTKNVSPGVVRWISLLTERLSLGMIAFRYTKIKYDSKNCSVVDCLSDSLSLSSDLLSKLGENYLIKISEVVADCVKAAFAVRCFGEALFDAEGGDTAGKQYEANKKDRLDAGSRAEEQYYYMLDGPFREWMMKLSARDSHEQFETNVQAMKDTARILALKCGQTMYDAAGPAAFAGHWSGSKTDSKSGDSSYVKNKPRHYSSPEAYLVFKAMVSKALGKKKEG